MISAADHLDRARLFLGAIPGAAERAVSHSLNAAVKVGRSEAVRAIAERYAVRPSDVLEALRITTATPGKLEASIAARSGSLSLSYFPHAPLAAGSGGPGRPVLSAEVKRGSSKPVGGAFIATLGGKPRIVIRTGEKTSTGKAALRTLFTTPLATMLTVEPVVDAVEVRVTETLDARIDREIDRELGRGVA